MKICLFGIRKSDKQEFVGIIGKDSSFNSSFRVIEYQDCLFLDVSEDPQN